MVRNVTTRVYPPGSSIDVVILLVANHLGTFTFSLCPRNSFNEIGKTLMKVDDVEHCLRFVFFDQKPRSASCH